jgi:hypothetical protein
MSDNILTILFKKLATAFVGFLMGILYGSILSFIAATIYVMILQTFHDYNISGGYVYPSSGMFAAILHAIIGATLFSPVFGNSPNKRKRIIIGISLGIIAGIEIGVYFLYDPSVHAFGDKLFVIYTAFFGGIGGFLVGLTNKNFLDRFINSKSFNITLDSTTAGIWSAIIGGFFAIIVCIISMNSGFWNKEREKLYIVVYSSPILNNAKYFASHKIKKEYTPEIYFTSNGFYAVTIGYYDPEKAKYVKENAIKNGFIEKESFLIGSKGIIKKVFP